MSVVALDPGQADWAVQQAAPGGSLRYARGMRDGGAPWLISASTVDGSEVDAVLRVGPRGEPADIVREATALRAAQAGGMPVPAVLGVRSDTDPALLLIERVAGSSEIARTAGAIRLAELGRFAARLNALTPPPGFERRLRSVSGVDFALLRRAAAPQELLERAEAVAASYEPVGHEGFVHGDLWQGNAMWREDELVAVIDWDCAGRGPGGVDLGSLRIDAATAFGPGAADHVLTGWESVAGPAPDLAYWDVVAALCTPPEIDWFADAIRGQGRPDLDIALIRIRRDDFLRDALSRWDSRG